MFQGTVKRVVLHSGSEGELQRLGDGWEHRVSSTQAHKFVGLDSASGGYPTPVEALDAHDFRTVEAARKYAGAEVFYIREMEIRWRVGAAK